MKPIKMILLTALITTSLFAQKSKKELDIEAIKAMCGCHEVSFKYTETFAPEIDYEKHHDYNAAGLEWVQLVEEDKNKVVLQHLLIVNDTIVIKHWRQDWKYQNTDLYYYKKDTTWTYASLDPEKVKGQWTQSVYSVDDSPRYSGTATWVHVDGKSYWENKTDAPLPRREYSKRKDYNVLKRGNRHEITSYGWVHEQDNDKIIREDTKEDILLAQEKGYNTYKKVEESRCKASQDYWVKNKKTWRIVRNEWNQVFSRKKDLILTPKSNEKSLYEYFFYPKEKLTKKSISSLINNYVK